MKGLIEIHWTCGSIDEARKICRYMVQERFVACAQIIPWIESIYMWNNQMETSQETKVVFKTSRGNFDVIKNIIFDNCSYEVPEITCMAIDEANEEYLNWMEQSVYGSSNH